MEKNIEATFAHAESAREYLKSVEDKDQPSPGKHDILLVSSKFVKKIHSIFKLFAKIERRPFANPILKLLGCMISP